MGRWETRGGIPFNECKQSCDAWNVSSKLQPECQENFMEEVTSALIAKKSGVILDRGIVQSYQSKAEQHKVSESKASELNALVLSKPRVWTSS